jgi:hypothetical protein
MMPRMWILWSAIAGTTVGCAGLSQPPLQSGESIQSVIAKLGAPVHRYQDGKEQVLEYSSWPWGQQTYMARIGPDGNLLTYQPVLTSQKFASIGIDTATRTDVLHTIGSPAETSYLPLSRLEVWSYPYKEARVWDSIMHVHFDNAGIVRKMINTPDPVRDPSLRRHFGIFGRF